VSSALAGGQAADVAGEWRRNEDYGSIDVGKVANLIVTTGDPIDIRSAIKEVIVRGQRMEGEPARLVERALEIDPKNLKALALAGTAAFERKDYELAARTWGRMLPLVPAESEDARAIRANIDEALALRGGKALRGEVRLDEKLKDRVSPDDTVFIFARAAEGPPMPLAVLRRQVRDLPASFALDDSMAMTPGAKLSNFSRVVVGARISRSGNAVPRPGDLQGSSAPVANDARGVSVLIDTVVR